MENIGLLENLKRKQPGGGMLFLLIISFLQLALMNSANADFTNGGFEDTYTPGATAHEPINGWTLTGYTFIGDALSSALPTSISGINKSAGSSPGGISEIIGAPSPGQLDDYFL